MKIDSLDRDIIWALFQKALSLYGLEKLLRIPKQKLRYRLINLQQFGWVEVNGGLYTLTDKVIADSSYLILKTPEGCFVFWDDLEGKRKAKAVLKTL